MFNDIKVDDRLEIGEDGSAQFYQSKVEAKLSDKRLVVYMPIYRGQIVKLETAKKYLLKFFVNDGNGSIIQFEASIVKYIRKESFNFIVFQIISDGEKVQRREFFRYSYRMPFKFFKMSGAFEDEDKDMDMFIRCDGVSKDIGGGGICFFSNEDIGDEVIKCELVLGEYNLLTDGKVVGKTRLDNEREYQYQYRVRFTSISDADRDRIVQYIFNEQRRTASIGK